MRKRSPLWAAPAAALATFASLASLTGACGTDLGVDLPAFCRERPADPECVGGAGTGGVGGGAGTGGVAGQPMQQGSGGGSPLMGSGGGSTAGSAGAGGSAGGAGGSAGGSGGSAGCGDVRADANNCGECGRVCIGGGACQDGACAPQTLARGVTAPHALAVDAANVYWASPASNANDDDPPTLMRQAKDGTGQAGPLLFATGGVARTDRVSSFALATLAGNDRFVVVGNADSDDLERYGIDVAPGTANPLQVLQTNEGTINHIAVAGGVAFWTGGDNDVVRSKNVNNVGMLSLNITGQGNPNWITTDAQARPYWVDNGAVRRPGSGGAPESVVIAGDPLAVEIAEGTIYWLDRDASELRAASLAETLPLAGQAIVTNADVLEGFAVDAAAGRIYWVSFNPTDRQLEVYRADLSGQNKFLLGRTPIVAASYGANPFGAAYVALDADAVYFADVGTVVQGSPPTSSDDGVVYRVAR
jgi:hypothetical protein